MAAGDPRLIDRTGMARLGTTDPSARSIYIQGGLLPPLLDRVVLHEVAHAVTMAYGLLPILRSGLPDRFWVPVEEWSAQLVENHALEAVEAASSALGRKVCVRGVVQ